MIDDPARAAIDAAIDTTLDRMGTKARALGPGFGALGDAVGRATAGGKRIRPVLVAASFRAFGGHDAAAEGMHQVAAAFELLHTAFVVHDDVIDHDVERRGVPNVGGEFRALAAGRGADAEGAALLGDAAGILAGDLLLHEAGRMVALADIDADARRRVFALFDDAIYVSAAGELADVENSIIEESAQAQEILDATFNKTAVYSFQAPLTAGAVLAGAPEDAIDVLHEAGGRLGLAFQLVDDLIGAFGTAAQAGRESGGDLRESKRTPLVALARESTSWPQVSDALALAHTGPVAVREAQRALEDSGARERMIALVEDTLDDVRDAADDAALPAPARALLRELADRVQERVP